MWCVVCGVVECRDTLKNPPVYIQDVSVCTGTKPTCIKHMWAWCRYTRKRFERTHGGSMHTPLLPLPNTHNHIQQQKTQRHTQTHTHAQRSQAPAARDRPPERTRNKSLETNTIQTTETTNKHRYTRDETRAQSHETIDKQQTHKERQRQTHETTQQRNTKHATRVTQDETRQDESKRDKCIYIHTQT